MWDKQKVTELTEQEKWECTVRWLNALYRHSVFPEDFPEEPCENCPLLWVKCPKNYPQDSFRVLEKYTGRGTIVGHEVHSGL